MKRKILKWLIITALPVIFIAFILFIICLVPIMAFAGDEVETSSGYDMYYGAEMGGAVFLYSDNGGMQLPFLVNGKFRVSSGFGLRYIFGKKQFHQGVDFPLDEGTPILASDGGTVFYAGEAEGYGNLIILSHANGMTTRYGHLSGFAVHTGDAVAKGQVIGYSGNTGRSTGPHLHFEVRVKDAPMNPASYINMKPDIPDVLPEELKYKEVNRDDLRAYLDKRNSILADEEYLNGIINAARDFNINPLLMFAITGQEQSFVPRSNPRAEKIARNPFNVYHSWYEYSTNINDTARIAARTIVNLSKNRPPTVNPIAWINRKYAEDKNWWIGVSKFFKQMQADVATR